MPATPTDAHIAKVLERIGEVALALRRGKGMAQELSALQLRVLGFVADRGMEPVGVALLADALQISRPTASDSVRVLVERGFLLRRPDPADGRSHALRLTTTGRKAATHAMAAPLQDALESLPQADKEGTLIALMCVLEALVHSGDLRVQRLCFTCKHYQGDKRSKHRCLLMRADLSVAELRTDCPDHVAVADHGPRR